MDPNQDLHLEIEEEASAASAATEDPTQELHLEMEEEASAASAADPAQELQIEMEEVNSPAAAADAFAKEEKQFVNYFKLTNGYVEPSELPLATAAAPQTSQGGQANPPARRHRGFFIHNRNMTDSIWLFGNQLARLVDELPNAYKAHQKKDYSYRFDVVRAKSHLVTLEVSLYNERTLLFLKKYYKPRLPSSNEIDEGSEWLPTPAVVSLDSQNDNPQALLKFALGAHRRSQL